MNVNIDGYENINEKRNGPISSDSNSILDKKISNQFNRITSLDDKFVIPNVRDEEIIDENSGNYFEKNQSFVSDEASRRNENEINLKNSSQISNENESNFSKKIIKSKNINKEPEVKNQAPLQENDLSQEKLDLNKTDSSTWEKSKLTRMVRKKYSNLLKNSIKLKGVKERYVCCSSLRKVTSEVIIKLAGPLFQSIISLLAIAIYVASTYYPQYYEVDKLVGSEKNIVLGLQLGEFAIAIIILIEYFYNLIRSKQKRKYLSNLLNILDLLLVLSIFITFFVSNIRSIAFFRVFRVVNIMRVFRFFKIIESQSKDTYENDDHDVTRRMITSILTVLAIVFLATGVVHFLNENFYDYFQLYLPSKDSIECESGQEISKSSLDPSVEGLSLTLACPSGDSMIRKRAKITFDIAFYYMVITTGTIGYGDIFPNTTWMRIVVAIFVIILVITITKQTSELNDILKVNKAFQKPYKSVSGYKHCILSGFFNKASFIKFLNEFYHIDHLETADNTKIVIIQPEFPDKDIQAIITNPKFEDSLHCIVGDIFSESTLQDAKAASASAIFLLSDQSHPEAMKNDQYLILACKVISQYSQSPIYVQFNFSQPLMYDWADWDIACSTQQIKMSIILKNGLIPGFATMIMNLSSSSSSFYNWDIKESPWMLEYLHGATQEVYGVKIPPDFFIVRDREFSSFSEQVYMETESLVIGVKRKVYFEPDRDIFYYIYLLNPCNYEFQSDDELIVISEDMKEANSIFPKIADSKDDWKNYTRKKSKFLNSAKNCENNQIKLTQPEVMTLQTNHNFENNFLTNRESEDKEKSHMTYISNNEINEVNQNYSHPNKFFQLFSNETKRMLEDRDSGESDINIIDGYSKKLKKILIPKKFQETQYFKIWENNSAEFNEQLRSHYLIFCKEDQICEFMDCFVKYYSEVVFFVSEQSPSSKWETIKSYYQNLIFIESSYSDQEDLDKLNLEKAKHVFVLTFEVEGSHFNDSGILPLVKIIEENYPKCHYTIELSDDLNVRYLNSKGAELSHIEDTTEITKNKKNNKIADLSKLPVRIGPKFAKSDILFSSYLESLPAFSYHDDCIIDLLSKLLGLNKNSSEVHKIKENDHISVFQYRGQDKILYEEVVKNFFSLDSPIIPIAVYRVDSNRYLKNYSSYLVTNPKRDLELNFNDKIICIGTTNQKKFYERQPVETENESKLKDNDACYINDNLKENQNKIVANEKIIDPSSDLNKFENYNKGDEENKQYHQNIQPKLTFSGLSVATSENFKILNNK